MSMRTLSNKFKTILEGISDIQNVYDYPWIKFDGYPAATITPSGLDSDYETTSENLRTYNFTVRLFVNINDVNANGYENKVSEGFRIIEQLVDTVIDSFDKDETLSGISLSSGYTMINVIPIPGIITYFEQEKIIVAEVRIQARLSFDTNS